MAPPNPQDPKVLAEEVHKLQRAIKEINEKSVEAKLRAATVEKDIAHLKTKNGELTKKNTTLEQRTSELETRVRAANHNAAARLANSQHTDPKAPLKQLHNAMTNMSIERFPRHENEIRIMGGGEVVRILKELEAPMGQTPADRKGALKEAIGLDTSREKEPKGA